MPSVFINLFPKTALNRSVTNTSMHQHFKGALVLSGGYLLPGTTIALASRVIGAIVYQMLKVSVAEVPNIKFE